MNIDYVFPKCSITFKGLIHDLAALSKKDVHKLSNIRLALLFLCFFSILFSAHIGSCTTLSADGSWSNVIGGEQVVIDPPNEVRWGDPASNSQKSGLRFDGYSEISVPIGENFCIGELTHFNYPIYPNAATQATLSVTLQFVDPAITSTFSFDLGIDETLNVGSCGDCSYEPCESPCPDRISILNVPGPQTFSVNGKSYTIEILGFTDTCPGSNPEQEVITQENRETTIYLVGRLQELGADLSITKTDSPDPVMAGGILTYALTVTNNGPSEATGVQLTDNLPVSYLANAEYRVESGSWLSYASGQSIALGSLAAGASTNIEIRGTVSADAPDGTLLTNSADVSSQTPDSNEENNHAQAETIVRNIPQADLSVTKTDSPDPVMAGGILTYALTVTNNGPSEATVVQLTDNLPASYLANAEYRVESGSWLSYASGQSIALGSLAAGASTNIEIRGTVSADATDETTLSNTAYVASQTFDPNMENNQAEAQTAVNIPKADLSLEKEASPDPVMSGSLLTYVLTVTNGGPSDATDVQLTDASAPDYLDNIEYRIGSDTWSPFPAGQSISLGNFANGESIIIEIRGTVPADTIEGTTLSNTAYVASQIFDPNMANNQAEAQTLVNNQAVKSDLSLEKEASPDPVMVENLLTYVLTVTNGGPSDATDVKLTDASAPDYLDNIEYRIGSDTWSPFPMGQSISLGNLANGESIIIEIRGTVPADTKDESLSNIAHVASQTFDPNMVNNQAEAQTKVIQNILLPQESALPTLKKNASSSTVAPGGIITYTIDFTCPQQGAVIQEKYPMGVIFVSSSPPPDSGTNDRWTFHGQSSGTIIVAVRAPHDPNIIFHLEQKAGGVGFMRAYKDLSTGREALVMVNTVVMTYTENSVSGSLSAESAVAVSGGAGTETTLRESGSGEYSSEELLNYYRCNRSIRDTSSLSASYQPSSFRLPGGRTVNYSSKWASADNSKNYMTSESIESQYLLAGKIDKESDIHLDRNGTKISTDSEFEGMYQSEYQKLAEPDSKGHRSVEKELGSSYSGSFKIKERLATTFSKRPNAITSVKHYDEPHVTVYQRSEQDQTNENNLNYTISILNDGNRALGPIRVSDIFPAGTYFLDSSTRPTEPRMEDLSESRYANWTFAHLPLGQAVTIYLRVIRYVVLDVPINAVYVSAGYDGQWFNASNITATNSNWLSCTPQGICTRSQSGGWNPPNWGFDLTKDICSFCPSGLINVADGQSDCPECTL